MNIFFLLLRIATGLMAVVGILLVLLFILLRSAPGFLKHLGKVIITLGQLFTSAFTKGTEPKDQPGWVIGIPQAGFLILFVAMIISVFLPSAKIYLHSVAGLTLVALAWYVWMMLTETRLEMYLLPTMLIWLVYYAMCIFWFSRQRSQRAGQGTSPRLRPCKII